MLIMLDKYTIEGIKTRIGEAGYQAESATGIRHSDTESFQIMIYDIDVEFEKKTYRVVAVQKWVYDSEDLEAVDHVDELSFDAWELERG